MTTVKHVLPAYPSFFSPSMIDAPEIFTALQQQLGLRLESRKEPVEMFVIDRLELPDPD